MRIAEHLAQPPCARRADANGTQARLGRVRLLIAAPGGDDLVQSRVVFQNPICLV